MFPCLHLSLIPVFNTYCLLVESGPGPFDPPTTSTSVHSAPTLEFPPSRPANNVPRRHWGHPQDPRLILANIYRCLSAQAQWTVHVRGRQPLISLCCVCECWQVGVAAKRFSSVFLHTGVCWPQLHIFYITEDLESGGRGNRNKQKKKTK